MTINAAQMVKNGMVRIHPDHIKLISQMRAAQFDKKGGIDKTELNADVLDCFIMACWDLKEFDYGSYKVTSKAVTHSVDEGVITKDKPIKSNAFIVQEEKD